jgi:biopolymer transport protein ExbB
MPAKQHTRRTRSHIAVSCGFACLAGVLLFLPQAALAQNGSQDFARNDASNVGANASAPQTGFEIPAEVNAAPETSVETTAPVAAQRRLTDIIRSGGPLMIPIGICSFILVVFVFERLISLRKSRIIPGPFTKRFLEQLRDGELDRESAIEICEKNNSPTANVFRAGVFKWGRSAVEVEQAVLDEGERTSNRLRKYLRLINGIATVCPLLGLLGTVLGMIQAFDSIATVGATITDPKIMIATGISQALLTTAAGMTVAIPALIAYLFFSSRVDKHIMEIDSLGMKVVNQVSAEAITAAPKTKRRAA